MDASVIDSFEFCRTGQMREGALPVAALQRLAEDTADGSGTIGWTLKGGTDTHGHPRLDLTVKGTVQLTCQRCLAAFAYEIDSASSLILAQAEEEIDGVEELLEDEGIDVIVGSNAFNVVELIEDEALLALPIAPKHEVCPETKALDELKATAKPSPFAVLKDLKK